MARRLQHFPELYSVLDEDAEEWLATTIQDVSNLVNLQPSLNI